MYGNYAPFYRPGYSGNMQMPMQGMQNAVNQYGQQFQPPQMPMQGQPSSDMILVLNENEATSYLVAPNNTVTLWDKNLPVIYVKSVDANGVPSMRVFDYVERSPNVPQTPVPHKCTCSENFVTIEKFNELKAQFDALATAYRNNADASVNEAKTEVKENE